MVVGTQPFAVLASLAGLETPASVLPLESEDPAQIGGRPSSQVGIQLLRLRDTTRGVGQIAYLLDVVGRPDAVHELDPVTVVVGDPDVVAGGENLAPLLFDSEEVARLTGIAPRALQYFGRELEDYVGPEVRASSRRIDALRIGSLEHVVRCALLPLRMHPLGVVGALVQDDVAPGHSGAGWPVTQIIRRDAGIDRRVLEFVGQAERLIHRVYQAPVVLLDPARAVPVAKRIRHTPDAALGVATHAVLPEQGRRVAHSAV